jgi:hypothetical protein
MTMHRASRRRLLHWAVGGTLAAALPTALAQDSDEPVIESIELAGARLELQFAPGFDAALRAEAKAWVQRSARAVADYFGRFPVPEAEVLMVPVDGGGIGGGVSFGEPNPFVRVRVGRHTTPPQFLADWVLAHEMVHLAIPGLPRTQRWFHEGVATYVEGIARTRAGLVAESALWGGLARGMPQGLPKDGDRGLDHTPTWGRTYWGGAMFCLLADVQMRLRSGTRVGLQHALRGVLAAGGNYSQPWPLERIVAAADAAIGQTTLAELYAMLKDCPRAVDLAALWQDLGVSPGDAGTAVLNGAAPRAALRRAILA